MIIKAVSLWQPWASLVPGPKGLETRGWDTSHRGPLLICAAQGGLSKQELLRIVCQPEFIKALAPLVGLSFQGTDGWIPKAWGRQIISRLPFGKAVATSNLVDTYPTATMTHEQIGEDLPFGDFSPKRFAWDLRDRKAIREPFPVRGRQGLFDVEIPEGLL